MNIFVLDRDPRIAAEMHCDKHVVKMVLETAQLLNNALIKASSKYEPFYKQSHKNHPCSLWASQSKENFDWLCNLGLELCREYTHRYTRVHKCENLIKTAQNSIFTSSFPESKMTDHVLCMPDQYKVIGDPVTSYRNYYLGDKASIAKWTKRKQPDWWIKC